MARIANVTVLFLKDTFSSTAIGPMEVFRHAGTLWNSFAGEAACPGFRVTTASIDGKAVPCDGPVSIQPAASLKSIRKTDLIFIPSTGLGIEDVVERNAAVVPWLYRLHKRGVPIGVRNVCSSRPSHYAGDMEVRYQVPSSGRCSNGTPA